MQADQGLQAVRSESVEEHTRRAFDAHLSEWIQTRLLEGDNVTIIQPGSSRTSVLYLEKRE